MSTVKSTWPHGRTEFTLYVVDPSTINGESIFVSTSTPLQMACEVSRLEQSSLDTPTKDEYTQALTHLVPLILRNTIRSGVPFEIATRNLHDVWRDEYSLYSGEDRICFVTLSVTNPNHFEEALSHGATEWQEPTEGQVTAAKSTYQKFRNDFPSLNAE